jgi:hypothetical protein
MRLLFFIILFFYLALAFWGDSWDYIETNGSSNYLLNYWHIFLPVAIAGSGLMYYLTTKAFPVTILPKNKKLLVISSFIFFLFAFIINTKVITLINCKGKPKRTIVLNGILVDKDEFRGIKKKKKRRRITIQAADGKQYRFSVKAAAFNQLRESEPFSKEFKVGTLGILYHNE